MQSTNIPPHVTGPFFEMVQSVSNDREMTQKEQVCPVAAEAIEDQYNLGKHLLL